MSETNELTASGWLEQNMGRIMDFSIRAGAVAYQGARIEDAMQQLMPGEPRDIALAQLHEELREEYEAMLAAQQALPAHDEFQRYADVAHAELIHLIREGSALHLIVDAEQRRIEDEVEQAAMHAPAAERQLMAYMQRRIAHLLETRGHAELECEQDVADMVERYAGALVMMSYVPIPEHLSPEERAEIEAKVAAGVLSAEVAPELPLDVHALAAAVREANPDVESQGLSTLAALVLLQSPGRWFTAAELGLVLYPTDDPTKGARKAASLLYHSLEGRTYPGVAARILAEHGYRLVRGTTVANEQAGQEESRLVAVYGIVQLEL